MQLCFVCGDLLGFEVLLAKQVFGEYYLRVKGNFVERAVSEVISFVELMGAKVHGLFSQPLCTAVVLQ